jgi:glucosylceramidase
LTASGTFNNLLAIKNPDNSVVIVIQNDGDADKMVNIKLGNKTISPLLKADSFNTFLLAGK